MAVAGLLSGVRVPGIAGIPRLLGAPFICAKAGPPLSPSAIIKPAAMRVKVITTFLSDSATPLAAPLIPTAACRRALGEVMLGDLKEN
jgi:hypothetical protein